MTSLREMLLLTLSFYRPMRKDEILLEMDKTLIESNPTLTMAELDDELHQLIREKRLKCYREKGSQYYLRIMPRSSLGHRFLRLLGQLFDAFFRHSNRR